MAKFRLSALTRRLPNKYLRKINGYLPYGLQCASLKINKYTHNLWVYKKYYISLKLLLIKSQNQLRGKLNGRLFCVNFLSEGDLV